MRRQAGSCTVGEHVGGAVCVNSGGTDEGPRRTPGPPRPPRRPPTANARRMRRRGWRRLPIVKPAVVSIGTAAFGLRRSPWRRLAVLSSLPIGASKRHPRPRAAARFHPLPSARHWRNECAHRAPLLWRTPPTTPPAMATHIAPAAVPAAVEADGGCGCGGEKPAGRVPPRAAPVTTLPGGRRTYVPPALAAAALAATATAERGFPLDGLRFGCTDSRMEAIK